MGLFNGVARERCGLPLPHGIRNAHIHNCTIADNVTITDITGFIANYDIGEGVVIQELRAYINGRTDIIRKRNPRGRSE